MSRIKILLAITISFFISRSVFAISIVESEFEMLLPRAFQQNLIETYWENFQKRVFKFSWDIPDQSYEAPEAKVDLKGINLSITSRLQRPTVVRGGESVIAESLGLQAVLNIKSIAIDQTIEREVGGVIGRFRVQAQCDNVNLTMKEGAGTFRIVLRPQFQGSLLRAQVENVELSWRPDAWTLGTLTCTGAQGFDDVIREEILKLTGNSAALIEKYKSVLDEYVRNFVGEQSVDITATRTLTEIRPDIRVTLKITGLEPSSRSSLLKGTVRVDFAKATNQRRVSLRLNNSDFDETVTSGALIRIPEEFVTSVAKQAFIANSFIRRISSENIPGFSALTSSRLVQLVVWPELLHYSRSAEFLFDVSTGSNLSISGRDLNYTIQSSLFAQMYAPRDGKYVPFMEFDIPLKSNVALQIDSAEARAKFTKVNVDLVARWEKSYLRNYNNCSTRFSESKIVPRVRRALEGRELSLDLPNIPVTDELSLRVDRVVASPRTNDLYIYLNEPGQGAVPH